MGARSIHAVGPVAVVVVAAAAALGMAGCAGSSPSAAPPSASSAPVPATAASTAPSVGPTRRPGEGEGAFVFRAQCAGCHGPRGEGDLGPALVGIAGRMTEAEEVARVRTGGGRMPAFTSGLTDEEITAVVRHTRDQLG